MKKSCIFIMALLLSCIVAQHAIAQLIVEQGKVKTIVAAGETVAGHIVLHNSTNQPIDVSVYLEDFEYIPPFDGTKKFFPAGATDRSVAQWFSFQPKTLQLPPYGKKNINYTAAVPPDASGGYYGVLFFERADKQVLTRGSVGVQLIARVGSLLFFETADSVKKMAIDDLKLDSGRLNARLMNRGNINLVAKCFFYILDPDGVPVDRAESQTYYLNEGATSDFSIDFTDRLSAGRYTAVLTFDLEDGISQVHEFDFSVTAGGDFNLIAD